MIGLRLGPCIRDVAIGKVKFAQVELIHTGSKCKQSSDWAKALQDCRKLHWTGYEKSAEEIFQQLMADNKIHQPRLEGQFPEIVNFAFWVETADQIRWQRAGEVLYI